MNWQGEHGFFQPQNVVYLSMAKRKTQNAKRHPPPAALHSPLAAVHGLGQELVFSRDEEQIARAVVRAAKGALRCQLCSLGLVQDEYLSIAISAGYEQSLQGLRLPLDSPQGLTVAVARSGEPLNVPDVSQDPRYVPSAKFQAGSELIVPLKSGERVIGVLNVESESRDAFDAADQQLLTTLADVAALALERARAHHAEEQQTARMTVLYRLSVTLMTERDPSAIVAHVFEGLNELLQVRIVTLSLLDPINEQLTEYSVDKGKRLPPQARPLDDAGLPALVIQSQALLRLDDLHTTPRPGPDVQVGARPHSWLGVPLHAAERVAGCISMQSYRPHAFGPDEERLLVQIAALVAPPLENARLLDQARRRLVREKSLTELAHTLGGEVKLATLIPRLLPPVAALTGADAGTVAVLEPQRQVITYPFLYNLPVTLAEAEAPVGEGLAWQVMSRRSPVLLDDYQVHPSALPAWAEAGIRSMLAVPLVVGDEIVGALGLFSLGEVRPFGPEAVAAAQAAGRLAAVAIQRAWLFGEERRRQRETEALRRASLALNATLDTDQVMQVLLEQIAWVIPYDSANVMMIEDESTRVTHLRGPRQAAQIEAIMALRLPIKQTPNLQRMYSTRRPHVVPDTRNDPDWVQIPSAEFIRSWAGAPIIIRDEDVIGFFSLDNETPNFYTPEHAQLLTAFAAHAAVAIENARLYQAAREHATQLENQVRERTLALQTERDRTQAILDSAAEGVSVTDLEGVILYVNPAVERLTGYSAAEILGQRPLIWQNVRQPVTHFEQMWQTVAQGQTWKGEITARRKDGTLYDAQVTIAPIPGPNGEPAGFVGIQSDISHLKEVERMKNQFISNVSHELRTPLANLKLYLTLLDKGRPEKRQQYLDTLQREAGRLQQLIEDLLNLSRLESGSAQSDRYPTDLNQLVRQLVQDRQMLAAQRELTLTADLDPDLPLALADEEMFGQVLTNLITNAMNYTPSGGQIMVRAGSATTRSKRWVTISVTDTGHGISKEEQEHLFERFYRGRAAQQTGAEGTGLGLAICREIVQQHEGRITVQSPALPPHPGGATFTVWIPAALTTDYTDDTDFSDS
jgi:PAS domain S-box-containing protein